MVLLHTPCTPARLLAYSRCLPPATVAATTARPQPTLPPPTQAQTGTPNLIADMNSHKLAFTVFDGDW
jgi:hypothetical protein